MALRSMAKGYIAKNDAWKGRQFAAEALDLAKKSKDRKAEAAALHMLAKVHLKEKILDTASRVVKEAIEMFKEAGNRLGEACALNTLAQVHMAEDKLDLALDVANEANGLFGDMKEKRGQVCVLHTIIQVKFRENRFYHALVIAQEMVSMYVQLGDARGEGAAHLLAIEVHLLEDNLQEAMESATKAAELFERLGDIAMKAKAILAMSRSFEAASQPLDAVRAGEIACNFFAETHNKRGQAESLMVIAAGHAKLWQHGKAVESLNEASFLYRQCRDKRQEAIVLSKSAQTQLDMFNSAVEIPTGGWRQRDFDEAVRTGERAVSLFVELGADHTNSAAYGRALLALAGALGTTSAQEDGLARAEEAQQLFGELGDFSGEAAALLVIAKLLQKRGELDGSISMAERCRDLAEEAGDDLVMKGADMLLKAAGKASKAGKMAGKDQQTSKPMDIEMFRFDASFIQYTSFQGRSTTTAPAKRSSAPSGAQQAIDGHGAFQAYQTPVKEQVLYTIKWHKMPRAADRAKLVIPESERHLITA